MKRRILISLMVISAASALVIGGLAAFTGTGTGTGDVAAGTVTVTVGLNSPDFDDGDVDDSACSGAGPGTCDVTTTAKYTGTLAADITAIDVAITNEVPSSCWTHSSTSPSLPVAVTTGDTNLITVEMTLSGAEACNGATADVAVEVTVTQT